MSWIVVLGQSMHFNHAWKIYYIKSAKDVSATAYIICINTPYTLAILRYLMKNRVLVIGEGLGLVGVILVLTGIFVYS